MISCTVPAGIRKVADRFKDIGDDRFLNYSNQCAIMCLFLFGLTSLSDVARDCPWSHSVSDLSRAVQGFSGNRYMRRLRSSILRRYKGKSIQMIFVWQSMTRPIQNMGNLAFAVEIGTILRGFSSVRRL